MEKLINSKDKLNEPLYSICKELLGDIYYCDGNKESFETATGYYKDLIEDDTINDLDEEDEDNEFSDDGDDDYVIVYDESEEERKYRLKMKYYTCLLRSGKEDEAENGFKGLKSIKTNNITMRRIICIQLTDSYLRGIGTQMDYDKGKDLLDQLDDYSDEYPHINYLNGLIYIGDIQGNEDEDDTDEDKASKALYRPASEYHLEAIIAYCINECQKDEQPDQDEIYRLLFYANDPIHYNSRIDEMQGICLYKGIGTHRDIECAKLHLERSHSTLEGLYYYGMILLDEYEEYKEDEKTNDMEISIYGKCKELLQLMSSEENKKWARKHMQHSWDTLQKINHDCNSFISECDFKFKSQLEFDLEAINTEIDINLNSNEHIRPFTFKNLEELKENALDLSNKINNKMKK